MCVYALCANHWVRVLIVNAPLWCGQRIGAGPLAVLLPMFLLIPNVSPYQYRKVRIIAYLSARSMRQKE
jgi:hypothetical protein